MYLVIFVFTDDYILFLGIDDTLQSPSSRIVVGQLLNGGTGSFKLLAQPNYVLDIHEEEELLKE